MTKPKIKTIFVDMDGVLADFVQGVKNVYGNPKNDLTCWNIEKWYGITAEEFWSDERISSKEFWSEMPVLGFEPWYLSNRVVGQKNVHILTTPTLSPECLSGKLEWLTKHIGPRFRQYIMTPNKQYLANPNALLIDDSGKNVKFFKEARGHAILYPQVWNKNSDLAGKADEYLSEVLYNDFEFEHELFGGGSK